jgi:hypothetical protein
MRESKGLKKTGDHFVGRLKGQAQGLRPGGFKLWASLDLTGTAPPPLGEPHRHVPPCDLHDGASEHRRAHRDTCATFIAPLSEGLRYQLRSPARGDCAQRGAGAGAGRVAVL